MKQDNEPKRIVLDNEVPVEVLKKRIEHLNERIKSLGFTWWGWSLSALFGGLLIFSIYSIDGPGKYTGYSEFIFYVIPRIAFGVFLGIFMYGYVITVFKWSQSNKLRQLEYELLKYGSEELQEKIEENFFTKLVQINFKYIDQYYLQTQEQADKSFRLASFAAISGLVIVIFGILMMLFNKTEPAYVTTAAGVLSEFIAAIFFYLYNKTILKMSQYHQKLVITQNISLALKITDEMTAESKAKSLEILIDRLTTDVNKHLTETK